MKEEGVRNLLTRRTGKERENKEETCNRQQAYYTLNIRWGVTEQFNLSFRCMYYLHCDTYCNATANLVMF